MRLSRGQKIVRNLLVCGLLWGLVYAMLDFPPYTVRGMLDQMERQCLLSDLEPVLVRKTTVAYENRFFKRRFTHLIARSGDTYVSAAYRREGLEAKVDYRWEGFHVSRDALCTAWDGTLYVAGDFTEAASAAAEVTVQRTTRIYDPDTEEYEIIIGEQKTFSYPGEKINDEVFSFYYREKEGDYRWDWESDFGLEGASVKWYSGYVKGNTGGGRGILHSDLPVKVTLYDTDGGVLDTLELSIDNYLLHIWY